MAESSGIKRVTRCAYCRSTFNRPSWAKKHATTCRKWPEFVERPTVTVVGEGPTAEYRIEGLLRVHHFGWWTFLTEEADRDKAFAEFTAMRKPRQPGVISNQAI